MIAHIRYRRMLDAFVDGELNDARAARVERHIRSCPMCGPDADITVRVKAALALHSAFDTRAAQRLRTWARGYRP